MEWAQKVDDLGAGEIIISSVDKEGTADGFDIELTKMISDAVSVPVIAHGGAGSISDIIDVIKIGRADAVSIASILHYGVKDKFEKLNFNNEGNTEFLKKNISFSKINPVNLLDLKKELIKNNINCRI